SSAERRPPRGPAAAGRLVGAVAGGVHRQPPSLERPPPGRREAPRPHRRATMTRVDAPPRHSATRGGAALAAAPARRPNPRPAPRSEEHTSELQSRENLVCRLLLEKKK